MEKPPNYEPPPNYTQPPPGYPQSQPGYPQSQPAYPQFQPGYPQSQAGYPQGQPIYNLQPAPVMMAPSILIFGDRPMQTQCPSCHSTVVTRTTHKVGVLAWLICGGLCLLGFVLGCQFIPFCVDACKDVEHHCPNCNVFLGVNKKI